MKVMRQTDPMEAVGRDAPKDGRIKCMAAGRMLAALVLGVVLLGAQHGSHRRRWGIYEQEMQTPAEDPPDAWEQTEFAFGRLRFRSHQGRFYQRWGIDANRADRLFSSALRRLTRLHVRSVEEIIDIESDEIFNWPFLYAVSAGDMVVSEPQAARLREYFARGGFLMVDDFHGEPEWADFMDVVRRVLPGQPVVELEEDSPIFHVVYDLGKRVRVPGANVVFGGQVERGGVEPHWRAVLDTKGRVQVAICFNMDLGDAWEFADDPRYPEIYASQAFRMGVNYVLYSMTH
jgi:hypothetical protein